MAALARSDILVQALFLLALACRVEGPPWVDGEAAGSRAPDFTLPDLLGNRVSLADHRGRPVIIDFWATWCAPCKEEIPWLIEFHRNYGEQGFKIIAINPEEEVEIVRAFVEAKNIPYTNLAGTGADFEAIAESYEVISYPTGFLVDGEGNIAAEFRGAKSKKVLERKIRELLDLPPQS